MGHLTICPEFIPIELTGIGTIPETVTCRASSKSPDVESLDIWFWLTKIPNLKQQEVRNFRSLFDESLFFDQTFGIQDGHLQSTGGPDNWVRPDYLIIAAWYAQELMSSPQRKTCVRTLTAQKTKTYNSQLPNIVVTLFTNFLSM